MSDGIKKVDNLELEKVTGGNAGARQKDDIHNPANFDKHYVDHLPEGTCLVMQMQPGGAVIAGHQFYNGEAIWVHNRYWEGGYFLALDAGTYGYVDAQYVR